MPSPDRNKKVPVKCPAPECGIIRWVTWDTANKPRFTGYCNKHKNKYSTKTKKARNRNPKHNNPEVEDSALAEKQKPKVRTCLGVDCDEQFVSRATAKAHAPFLCPKCRAKNASITDPESHHCHRRGL